ncbi:MAG: hypothetical protein WC740_17600 [Verrucomicrobiia bacterium]
MRYITREMVEEAINSEGRAFDSHDVERRVLRNHREAVALEIIRFIRHVDMLSTFSRIFGRFIQRNFAGRHGLLREAGRSMSPNLRGKNSRCEKWEKVSPRA